MTLPADQVWRDALVGEVPEVIGSARPCWLGPGPGSGSEGDTRG